MILFCDHEETRTLIEPLLDRIHTWERCVRCGKLLEFSNPEDARVALRAIRRLLKALP